MKGRLWAYKLKMRLRMARSSGTSMLLPPVGGVQYDEAGNPRSHVCGNGFAHLPTHVRRHQMTIAIYRATFGLNRQQSLIGRDLRVRMAEHARRNDGAAKLAAGKARVGQKGGPEGF